MRVKIVAYTECEGGNCPTTYITDRGTVLVQGYDVAQPNPAVGLPPGHAFAEVPPALLERHARRQGGQRWIAPTCATEQGTVLVAGAVVDDPEALAAVRLPAGETLVEVTGDVIA
jgi:hypothetical protein